MPELPAIKPRNLLDLIPILAAALLLALTGAHFERHYITISSVDPVHAWPVAVMAARDVLILLFALACGFAASTSAKWARVALWSLPLVLLGVIAARPAIGWFIHQANGPGIVVGLWWATIFLVACLFLRANRWAGGLMVPHVAYATYVSLAVWWTWLRG